MARIWSFVVLVFVVTGCDSQEVPWWEGCIDVVGSIETNWNGEVGEACSVTAREVDLPITLKPEAVDACVEDVLAGECGSHHVCGKNWECSFDCNEIRVFQALQTKDTAGYSQADVICGR